MKNKISDCEDQISKQSSINEQQKLRISEIMQEKSDLEEKMDEKSRYAIELLPVTEEKLNESRNNNVSRDANGDSRAVRKSELSKSGRIEIEVNPSMDFSKNQEKDQITPSLKVIENEH